jgi:hypothetical protein
VTGGTLSPTAFVPDLREIYRVGTLSRPSFQVVFVFDLRGFVVFLVSLYADMQGAFKLLEPTGEGWGNCLFRQSLTCNRYLVPCNRNQESGSGYSKKQIYSLACGAMVSNAFGQFRQS